LRRSLGVALTTVAVGIGACGGEEEPTGSGLTWAEPPTLIRAATGGPDRVLVGEVRNESPEQMKLIAEKVEVRDANGKALEGDAGFTATYAHGLYGADVSPERLPPSERSRLGLTVYVEPGGTEPVYAAFRDREAMPPLSLDYGEGTLEVPETLTTESGS